MLLLRLLELCLLQPKYAVCDSKLHSLEIVPSTILILFPTLAVSSEEIMSIK